MRGKGGDRVKNLKPVLSEDSPRSDFPKKSWILEGTTRNQIVLKGKGEGMGGEEEESLAKNEETEKEPKVDKTKV